MMMDSTTSLIMRLSSATNENSFVIEVDAPMQVKEASTFPYDEIGLRAILKSLEVVEFHENHFRNEEIEWLLHKGLLISSDRGNTFRGDFRELIGHEIFDSLIPGGDIRNSFVLAREYAKKERHEFHIEIGYSADDPKHSFLSDYPWELIYSEGQFVAEIATFSRYIRYGGIPNNFIPNEQQNILIISSRPPALEGLQYSDKDVILNQLAETEDAVLHNIDVLEPPTFDALLNYLNSKRNEYSPTLIHFDGHGTYGWRCNNDNCLHMNYASHQLCELCKTPLHPQPQGYLGFEATDKDIHWVGADDLAAVILQNTRWSRNDTRSALNAVVLSACRTGVDRINSNGFRGVAQRLIKNGVPMVVAMAFMVDEKKTRDFVKGLYRSLFSGDSMQVSVGKARGHLGYSDDHWYRPVLYQRFSTYRDLPFYIPKNIYTQAQEANYVEIEIALAGLANNYDESKQDTLLTALSNVLEIEKQEIHFDGISNKDCIISYRIPESTTILIQSQDRESLIRRLEENYKNTSPGGEENQIRILSLNNKRQQNGHYTLDYVDRKTDSQFNYIAGTPYYIEIDAPVGYGKTYFLNNVASSYEQQGWKVIFIDFEKAPNVKGPSEFLSHISMQLEQEKELTIDGIARYIFKNAIKLVIVIDSSELADIALRYWIIDEFLPKLEERRNPPIERQRAIVAGRINFAPNRLGKPKFEPLRLYPLDSENIENIIRKQYIKRSDLDSQPEPSWYREISDEIYHLSKGYPLCILNVIRWLDVDQDFSIPIPYFRDRRADVFFDHVKPAIENHIMGHLTKRETISLVKLFSVLRGYNANTISWLLQRMNSSELETEYRNNIPLYKTKDPLSVLREINKAELNSNIVGLYRFDYTIRQLISLQVEYETPALYWKIHQLAYEMFNGWARGVENGRPMKRPPTDEQQAVYMVEALYHKTRLIGKNHIPLPPDTKEIIEVVEEFCTNSRSSSGWEYQTIQHFYDIVSRDDELQFSLKNYLGDQINEIMKPVYAVLG